MAFPMFEVTKMTDTGVFQLLDDMAHGGGYFLGPTLLSIRDPDHGCLRKDHGMRQIAGQWRR